MGCRLLASNPGACRTLLVRDGAVLAPHKDLPLLPAFPRCTLCTTRPQQLDADTCPAYGRVLQIGTHILHALPLFQLQSGAALRFDIISHLPGGRVPSVLVMTPMRFWP